MKTENSDFAQIDELPDSAFIRMPTMTLLYGGVTPACIYKWVKAGLVPAPTKLGPQVSAWNLGEIRRNLAAKVAA